MKGDFHLTMNLQPLDKLRRKSPEAFNKALKVGGIQLLTWMNTGAGGTKNSRKPPIRFGVLRGSSSVFVGGELVDTFDQQIRPEAEENPTPNKSHSAKPTTITVGWNTDYAAKMHEYTGPGGYYTRQDGNAGGKWIEEHIKSDRNLLMEVIGKRVKKELGI